MKQLKLKKTAQRYLDELCDILKTKKDPISNNIVKAMPVKIQLRGMSDTMRDSVFGSFKMKISTKMYSTITINHTNEDSKDIPRLQAIL